MTNLVPAEEIEQIVGIRRHETLHYARAVTDDQTVYILHSAACKMTTPDLRVCPFSVALDRGIRLRDWADKTDQPARVAVRDGRLIPWRRGGAS